MTTTILFKKMHPAAIIPSYGSDEAAGLDIHAIEDVTVVAGEVTPVSTGLAMKPPKGTYGQISPRSGLGRKYGVQIIGGVIDRDYRGHVVAMLLSTKTFTIKAGDRFSQLILKRIERPQPKEATELDPTERGGGGFGSTGI